MEVLEPSKEGLTKEQEKLVKKHLPLVKRLAYYMLAHLPKTVQLDDLIQAGTIGLLEAAKNFDSSKGAQFETYANIRIRGFILDEVRKNDWVPRSVHKHSRMISKAATLVENRLSRPAKHQEIADELHVTLQEYYELQKDSLSTHLYSLEDLGLTEDVITAELGLETSEPDDNAEHNDLILQISKMIKALPHNEKLVLSLYYEHDLNLKEIGEVLGVSESRVSQIHSQATSHLKSNLEDG
ncbi:MAG: RNA polymerase sigma factor FliA [Legionellales bacterium RIFCSPHIGHO2_12_FULL_37_14]|nr:MAG: RNA polymerase sigma factor FliA [Legionellales bacterium RIFCSPHIGHO2_12_FULL_37_14]